VWRWWASASREQHERRQIHSRGQLVQVHGAVHFRAEHGVDAVPVQAGDGGIVQHTGGVHHGGQRMLARYLFQHGGDLGAVGDITRRDRHRHPRLTQPRAQFLRAGGGHPAPADQQQMPHPVPGGEVTCHR
jgi:hypothetical protein